MTRGTKGFAIRAYGLGIADDKQDIACAAAPAVSAMKLHESS
jgi:hypothetical protein